MSKQITQIEKNSDTNTILFKNTAGDIVTACYAGGLIAEEREAGTKVLVMTTDRKPLVSLTVADITTPVVADAQALLIELAENFFFDVSGSNGELVYHGELNDVPSGVGSQLLVNVPLESNCTYFMLILATARVGTERFSNMTPNYIRVYVSSMGVITLDNSGAASLFETFTINVAGGLDIATPNLFKYTFNCSTNVSTDVRATIKLIKHQF